MEAANKQRWMRPMRPLNVTALCVCVWCLVTVLEFLLSEASKIHICFGFFVAI